MSSSISQSRDGAEAYDGICRSIQSEHFKFMMLTTDVQKGWKILDVGCGTGYDTVSLSTLVGEQGKIVGIDPIMERIEVARQCYKKKNLTFHTAFGNDASTFGKDFDLAISCQVMQWIPSEEKPATFQSIADCLKSEGEFVFLMAKQEANPESKFIKLLSMMPKNITGTWGTKLFYESGETLEKMAMENGFNKVTVEDHTLHTAFDSVDDLFQWMAASLHVFDFTTLLESLKSIAEKNDMSFMCNEEGKIDMNMAVFLIKCKKQ